MPKKLRKSFMDADQGSKSELNYFLVMIWLILQVKIVDLLAILP
jgi:hypothetical protein